MDATFDVGGPKLDASPNRASLNPTGSNFLLPPAAMAGGGGDNGVARQHGAAAVAVHVRGRGLVNAVTHTACSSLEQTSVIGS